MLFIFNLLAGIGLSSVPHQQWKRNYPQRSQNCNLISQISTRSFTISKRRIKTVKSIWRGSSNPEADLESIHNPLCAKMQWLMLRFSTQPILDLDTPLNAHILIACAQTKVLLRLLWLLTPEDIDQLRKSHDLCTGA